jgi:beta-lactamase class D
MALRYISGIRINNKESILNKSAFFSAILITICSNLCAVPSFASGLMDHFKGRYGAIELFDTEKKLSFRVNAPELSEPRDFCEFHQLSTGIAAIELGLLKDFEADVASLDPKARAKNQTLRLKTALRKNNKAVFEALSGKIGSAKLQTMHAQKLIPSAGGSISAFALLEWFKALESNSLKLKATTLTAIRSVLAVRKANGAKLLSFSSRCALARGALGASIGVLQRTKLAPIYFAVSVDGKSRKDLFYLAPGIRDAALTEMGYFSAVSPNR